MPDILELRQISRIDLEKELSQKLKSFAAFISKRLTYSIYRSGG